MLRWFGKTMRSIKIKTLWQGKVGIRDKFIKEVQKNREGIQILHANTFMNIGADEISSKIVGKSDFPVKDKYSSESHYLLYFLWKPDNSQKSLF